MTEVFSLSGKGFQIKNSKEKDVYVIFSRKALVS